MEVGLRPASVNPAAIRMKASRKRERLLSDTEVSKIMSALDQLEANGTVNRNLALAVRLMFATAARAGEVCKLEWQHVDFEVGTLTWPDSKTGFLRKPIVAEARRLLTEAKAHRVVGCRWVCPQTDPAKPMRIETLRLAFKAAMTLAGVEANERASLHLIRHAVASRIYSDPSVPLPIAMRIVGHANVGTAMRYAHVSQEDVLKVAQKSEKRRNDAIEAAGREIAKAAKARKVVEIGTRR
jgi:integrase